jgi:hypothetical protein
MLEDREREIEWDEKEGGETLYLIGERQKHIPAPNVPTECPLVHVVVVRLR